MNAVISIDLVSAFLSLVVFGLVYKMKPSFKMLIGPVLLIFYAVGVLAIAQPILELAGYVEVDDSLPSVGLHLGILGIIILAALSLNTIRVKQLNRDLEEEREASRMKTEFLARTSHELKTPLTPLLMQLQMLLRGNFGSLNKEQAESLDMVERNIKRLSALINDILYFSRTSAGKVKLEKAAHDLNSLVDDSIETMLGKAKRKLVSISFEKGELPLVECDADRINEIMDNLLDNAIKFVEKGGSVLVKTGKKDGMAIVCVRDNGVGISKENMPNLFKPFTQFDEVSTRKYGGTGIGLSICKNLVKLHGGDIWASSKGEGKGAAFYFSLPLK